MDEYHHPSWQEEFLGSPILVTKLYRPALPAVLVPRSRLLERLDCNRLQPLILISASAGYGKTTLASTWLQAVDCASAWLSLDEGDNDLRTFITYLLAAVRGAFPAAKLETEVLLQVPVLPPAPVLARYLLNDLDQIQEPFILALDDLQLIRELAIYDLIGELVRHPSRPMHLLLISRRDPPLPIATLRGRGQMLEIRATDLRFTVSETAQLLAQMLNRDVSADSASEWTQRTEGWVTGLRLAALSLRHRNQAEDLRLDFQGDSRYLQEYLLAEVLADLPPVRREWLQLTSILDRFCAPLCDAVCRTEAAGEANDLTGIDFLGWLQSLGLFLVPLDGEGRWFRFHHLFQELLRRRLEETASPHELAAKHLSAGRWFVANGLPDEALQHLLTAGETSAAIQLVAEHRHQLMNAERWNQLERWLRWFPDEVVANDPILSITMARLPSTGGRGKMQLFASQAARLVASMLAESPVASEVRAELACDAALEALLTGQPAKAISESVEALATLPTQSLHLRGMAVGVQAVGYQMSGDSDRGVTIIDEALRDPGWPANERAKLLLYRSVARLFEGDLAMAQQSADESLGLAVDYDLWGTISQAHYVLGITHYLRDELLMAEPHFSALVKNLVLSDPPYLVQAVCCLARIYDAWRHPEEADKIMRLTSSHLEETGNTFSWGVLRAFQVELALDRGQADVARRLSRGVNFITDNAFWFHYVPQLTPVKLWLLEGTANDLKHALDWLEQIDEQALKRNRRALRIDVLALQALAHDAQGDWDTAAEKLGVALSLAEPGGFVRNFVDLGLPMADLLARLYHQKVILQAVTPSHIARILEAFSAPDAAIPTSKPLPFEPGSLASALVPFESLTKRELHVLRMLATELSPEEIARGMVVSTSTVRTHIKSTYSKLDVHSRFEAVQRARELGML